MRFSIPEHGNAAAAPPRTYIVHIQSPTVIPGAAIPPFVKFIDNGSTRALAPYIRPTGNQALSLRGSALATAGP